MQEIDITLIKERSIKGIVALTSRTFLLQIIAFSATFLLTIFLTPQIFGVFYVVSAIIAFLGYFSDIGLAAALIQKKEALTHEDLSTTFTIQQILVGSAVVIALVCSDVIGRFYGLDTAGIWLFRALVISFFLSSLKTIPSVLLERTLEFNKLIIPNILETVAFYAVAVFFAWKGYGIQSFTWAVITRAVVGLIAMYIVSPWRVTIGISQSVAKKLLKFGVPFQLNSFLALLKDDLLTVFLGKVLPFAEIGYIGWAKKWAEVPLRLIMDSVIRVTFPAFSRLQESKEHLGRAIEKALFGVVCAMMPVSIGLIFFVAPLITVIPKYGKWEPAVVSFYFFALVSLVASISTPLTNALNAVGKIKITLLLMVMWTILTWIMVMICIRLFGFTGVSIALFLVSLTVVIVVLLAKKIASFSLLTSTMKPITGGLVQTGWYVMLLQYIPRTMAGFILAAGSGVILYVVVLWLIDRKRISELFCCVSKISMTKISVVISAFNEEKKIGRTLSSLRFADEIVLVDNGSIDKTAAIAREHGAKVYHRKNNPMLNVNKNYGFGVATGDWILSLDADEEIPGDLAREIRHAVSHGKELSGYWIARKNIIFGKWIEHGLWWPDKQLRLFRRGMGAFPCKHVHEYLAVEGTTGELTHPYIHHNYETISQFIRKMDTIYTENEVQQLLSAHHQLIWYDAIRFPISDFVKVYFAQGSYKDGLHGLVISMLQAFYSFVVFAKLWEHHQFTERTITLDSVQKELRRSASEVNYWTLTSQIKDSSNPIMRVWFKLLRRIKAVS